MVSPDAFGVQLAAMHQFAKIFAGDAQDLRSLAQGQLTIEGDDLHGSTTSEILRHIAQPEHHALRQTYGLIARPKEDAGAAGPRLTSEHMS